jgi:hypothetical protein
MAQPTMFDARSKIGAGGFVFGIAFGAMLQLGDIHYPELMSLAGVIAASSLVYMTWHGINVLLFNRGKPSLKLEPVHLIILGLLIAAAGVGWQFARNAAPNGICSSAAPNGICSSTASARRTFRSAARSCRFTSPSSATARATANSGT